jgi:hypothetical protein
MSAVATDVFLRARVWLETVKHWMPRLMDGASDR